MTLDPSPQLLLVHDDSSVSRDYQTFFRENGWSYDCVSNFNDGLKAAFDNSYEIIITDLDLPDMRAQAFLENVRDRKPNQAVMVVSSAKKAGEAIRALRSGAVDFLQKPIDYRFLHETITRIVSCLREEEAQYKLLKCLNRYSASYKFDTRALGHGTFVPPILNELCLGGLVDQNAKLKITLAIQEALANAVEHGNLDLRSEWKDEVDSDGADRFSSTKQERLNDPAYADLKILVNCLYDNGKLSITIKDQGKGFDAPKQSDLKFADDTSLLCHGRGLTIIFSSMDTVQYEDGGTKVTISKTIF